MNRLEKFLMDNFDTDIEEVKEFELLLALLPLMAVIVLDSIFKFIIIRFISKSASNTASIR